MPDESLGPTFTKKSLNLLQISWGSVILLPQSSLNLYWYDCCLLFPITQLISCHVYFISFLVFSNFVKRYILFDLRIGMFNLFL